MDLNFSENAITLINAVESEGYEIYSVGGCVRDFLRDKPCADLDFATSATPFEMEEIFDKNNIKYFETGLKHGTITAIINEEAFEITTYRKDGEYFDSRHPENVCFVREINEDLSRRDFTINAIAYSDKNGYVDLFDGMTDLENHIIKAVGDPDKRFNEDALRIMRAIRFASTLGFTIEENTKKSIFKNKSLLLNVSVERLFVELTKLLMGDNAFNILMEYREVIATFLPDIEPCFDAKQNNRWHLYTVWEHICHTVENSPEDSIIRIAMLFHDIAKPQCRTTDEYGDHFYGHQRLSSEIAHNTLKKLKASNEIIDRVCCLIEYHDITIGANKRNVKKWLSRLGEEMFFDLLCVQRADRLSQNLLLTKNEIEELDKIKIIADEIIADGEALSLKDLKINGHDIVAMGYKGKIIGQILNELLSLVIDETLENEKEELVNYVKLNFNGQ